MGLGIGFCGRAIRDKKLNDATSVEGLTALSAGNYIIGKVTPAI